MQEKREYNMVQYRDLFYEPASILNYLTSEYSAEMSENQLAFLCGLIKKYKPQKIVEVGVSAGGTTAVVLNCVSMLGLDAQLYSLDLSSSFYRDKSRKTGYLVEECKSKLERQVPHALYTGKYAVEYLQEIGGGIDFLILDTVHSLPGELFDFLAFYPFLKRGAVVVLHDIVLNLSRSKPHSFATKVLLDTIAAEKFYGMEDDSLLNIGAFAINEDTDKYINNVFSALTLTWKYSPKERELSLYRDFYLKYYDDESMVLFDVAVRMNQKSLRERRAEEKRVKKNELLQVYQWIEGIKCKNRIYIYGCGYFGKKFYDLLNSLGACLGGFIISDDQNKDGTENVYYLSELNIDTANEIILLGVEASLYEEIEDRLLKRGLDEYVIPPKCIYDYLG